MASIAVNINIQIFFSMVVNVKINFQNPYLLTEIGKKVEIQPFSLESFFIIWLQRQLKFPKFRFFVFQTKIFSLNLNIIQLSMWIYMLKDCDV